MINLALRTEYSFKKCFGFVRDLPKDASVVGVADSNNTIAHTVLEKACNPFGVKPIFGVRLTVSKNYDCERGTQHGPEYIFIAKNEDGLREIYALVKDAWDNFWYIPRISFKRMCDVSNNIFVITPWFQFANPKRVDYLALSVMTPSPALEFDLPRVYINDNNYPKVEDFPVYELLMGRDRTDQTYPQHILSAAEFDYFWECPEAEENTLVIADQCNVRLPKSTMVRHKKPVSIEKACRWGARKRGINLDEGEYADRYNREIKLIKEKEYADYFMIVSDMVQKAKDKMLVGPGRGSSGGSLVAYLLEITEVDPLQYGLLFERFIDINRSDPPDIDVDFPDSKRSLVIKDLEGDHGKHNVKHVANINTFQPKSAIGLFAAGLGIPKYKTEDVKDAIIERSGGDARAAMCIQDTFETTEVGKRFIEEYPAMKMVSKVEGHAAHTGTHAAGIIVCNDPLEYFCGVNDRDHIVMIDKEGADYLNLLKMDCLGLRTLTILEEVAQLAGFKYKQYYNLDLDDEKVFEVFNSMRLSGIFQFTGYALQSVTKQMGVHSFDDIIAITALARPGPLHSGGTNLFAERKTGKKPIEYISTDENFVKHTESTLGIIIYQEQLMSIGREYGGLSWEDVSALRKAAAKSMGEEFFNKYRNNFLEGTRKRGIDDEEAISVWENMVTFGSWGFNKSHAVSYALISYWTAWAKAYYPLEFACANLNNAHSEDSALKILRDMVENDGIEYETVDPDRSEERWSIKDGKLLCGLTSIHGIGVQKAKSIIKTRNTDNNFTPAIFKKLISPKTKFDILYPCKHYWGDIYENPGKYQVPIRPFLIRDIKGPGEYIFIGKLVDRNLRDLNEYQSVVRRGGEIIEEFTLFLNFTLEDDTDSIICTINRYKFEIFGREIAESGVIDHDWYIVQGHIKDEWRRISVDNIGHLNRNYPEMMTDE